MRANFDSLKEKVAECLKVGVLYQWEVKNIVGHLGREYRKETICNHLFKIAVSPADLGIDSTKYDIDKRVKLYPQDGVWQYLKQLEEKKVIDLEGNNMEGILAKEFNKR